jgi:[ribosomal protein S5]-alanine N-acetyltransferase
VRVIDGDRLPTLRGDRLELRWLEAGDVPALFEIFSHAEVMRFWSSPPFVDLGGAQRLLDEIHGHFQARDLFQWGVALRSDGRVIGTCTLAHLDVDNLRAELGFALGRAHWGRGYIGEALPVLLDFAFGELGLRRLEADVDPRNHRSIRTLERLGFQPEGLLRERWFVAGEVQDSALYGLLRREWDAKRRS